MKKLLSAFVLSLFLTSPVIAAESIEKGPDGEICEEKEKKCCNKNKGSKAERLGEKLGLSEEQKMQVETIFKEQKEKRKALKTETQNLIQGVLNEEQKSKWQEMHLNKEKRCEHKK